MGKLLGNFFVLAAAFGYAVYEVFLDKTLACDARDVCATSAFVSLSGGLNVVLLWPVVICLGAPCMPVVLSESLSLPPSSIITALGINAMLATIFNVMLAMCVVSTSPLITSVACMLTIPTSLVVDTVAHGDHFGPLELAGSALIIIGFCLLVFDKSS